jgi:hypothetical protein
MSLIYELIKENAGFTIINANGKELYIEGINKLVSVSENEIKLSSKKALIVIEGKELYIIELDEGSVTVSGEILSVRTEKNEK